MNEGADVLSTLGWGLRRYAWLVLLFIIALGVVVPLVLSRGADVYDAEAQVGPKKELRLNNLDPLPRLGESVFGNGAVENALRREFDLDAGASVVPQRAELVAAQDNIVFEVVGHGDSAEDAQRAANTAAAAFTIELNKYSNPSKPSVAAVGEFVVHRKADVPEQPAPALGGGLLSIAIGLLAGALAGIGAVALLLIARRPVIDAASAKRVAGAPVLGSVTLPRDSKRSDDSDLMGVAALCRRLLASSPEQVMLTSARESVPLLHQLGSAIERYLAKFGRVMRSAGAPPADASGLRPDGTAAARRMQFVVADGPTDAVATLPSSALTLLVVPRGVSMRSLEKTASEYLTGGPAGLVLVDKAPWYPSRRRPDPQPRENPADPSGGSSPSDIFPFDRRGQSGSTSTAVGGP
jgi:hypothetical protein